MTPSVDDRRTLLRGLVVAGLVGVFLAVTGAFGSIGAPFPERLAYWILVMVLGGLWGHLCSLGVGRFLNVDDRPWLTVAVMTGVITGPLCVIVWVTTGLFFNRALYPLATLPQMFVPVLVVTLAITTLNVFLGRAQPVQTHAPPPSEPPPPVRFLDRLPMKLRGATLHAVQAEDHYLRLHTDRGSDLILMRLSDAVEELEGLEGARTHRSWWVARSAVRGVERGDGRATLTLEGGLSAPVSRRYARSLREANWW
ncbi:LytTR family DNA-binding domain-containing protein [Brevundimonas sp.]|uniref:LytTR family DNA-binding domain-containing protein n=1 Tax=Brevundimonas sp. TaxID=1871086 RepID=UPI00182C5A78|nr:LytTR family DNA-binding domain-containing protein [Brevundimonas sp.]MBA4808504.1 LytTR family transcriptional regulator DNA-binding domain-containing protein [Brevundimonas sp.]